MKYLFILMARSINRMYRLAEGSHWDHWCACDDDNSLSYGALDMAVFGGRGPRWYWAPTTDYAPASDESPKPVEPPKRHIELAVVKIEDGMVCRIVLEWDHYQKKKESEYSRKEQECAARMLRDGYDIDDIF